ncbi:hypothetical protein QJS10_CPA08g00144 [Acorus calamus]|uniref:PHD-type domain-containing protein n=1 Tax=Acorus calamus TaxID=4465 RepID=A0AAV9E9P9_ACOCL|nr:hypothetical protein QJS10_CPA08g00144 [Acorus calamus]
MEEGTEKPLKVLRTSLRGRKRRLAPEEADSESDGIQRVVYVPDSGGKSLVVHRKSPVKREAGIDRRRGKGPVFGRKRSSDEDYEKPKRGRGRPPKKLRRGLRVQGKSVVLKPEKMYTRRGVREIRKNSVSSPNVSSADVSERPKSQEKSAKKQFLEKNRTREPEVEPVKAEVTPPVKGRENGRMTEKQNLRERMKEMLLSLGWEIDMRPRNGKDYEDQVYISPPPKRRGYWSILNAYYALLEEHGCTVQDVEEQVLNGKVLPFMIIPREELALLKRNQVKKRVSKKWQEQPEKKGKDGRGRKRKAIYEENRKDTKRRKVKEDYEGDSFVSSRKETSRAGKAKRVSGDKGRVLQGRRCRLLVRGSNQNEDAVSDDYVLFDGKRTVLSWMIDLGVILENGKVKYMNRRRTRAVHEGSITRDGINCMCCSKIVTVLKFEVHAGSKLCQPYENIFVDGVEHSLLQCQQDAWNKQEESERRGFYTIDTGGDDPNDDTCIICGDGGDLICCDSCPSTFHQSCLGIKVLPSGDWHCPNCSCRFCGEADSSSNHGNSLTNLPLRSCGQCQEKFHQKCISEANGVSRSSTSPFCGKHCRKLFGKVQKLLGVQHPLEAGFSWTLIKRFDEDSKISLPGHALRAECNSKLAVALTVMDECFLPIIDQRSGINLIHNVLYNCGSNFNRLDYSGFYTMVLEREDEIISVATIRIHGTRLAEMPFIGTRIMYRRQGMCRRLMNAIETVLRSLNVEKLVIPAISELFDTWTMMFGFKPLEETHKQEMKSISMLVFPFTDMLHKPLLKKDLDEESPMPIADGKNMKVKSSTKPEMANNSNVLPLSGHDSHSLDKMCELHQPTVKIVDDGAISEDQKVSDHSGMETKSYTVSVDSHLQMLHGGILNHRHEVKIETDGIQPINESGDADVSGGKSVHGNAEHPDGVLEANPDEATHLNSSELQTAGPVPDGQSSKGSFHAVTVHATDTEPEYRAPEEASGNHTSGAISDSSILVASESLFASHIELEAKVVEDFRHTAIEDSSFQVVDNGEKDEVFSHSSVVVANLSHTACLEFEIKDGMNSGHYASKTSSEKFDDSSVENKALSDCYVAVGNEFCTVCPNEVNVTMGEDSVHHPDGVLEANTDETTRLNSSELLTAGPVPDGQSSEESFHTATEDSSFQVDNGEKDEVFSHSSVVVANLSHTACPEFEIRDGMNYGHYASKTSSEKFDDTSVENKALSHCYVAVGNEFRTVCPNDVNVTMGEDSVHHELIYTLRVNNEVAFAEDGSSSGGSGDNTMVTAVCSRSSVSIESSAAVSVELDTYAGNECMVDGMHENKVIASAATAVAATEQAVETVMVHVPSSDTASGEKAQFLLAISRLLTLKLKFKYLALFVSIMFQTQMGVLLMVTPNCWMKQSIPIVLLRCISTISTH